MLGKINASPSTHDFTCSTFLGFCIPQNLEQNKRRFETCLNGESSLVFSSCSLNPINIEFSQKFNSYDSSLKTSIESTEDHPVPNRMAPRQLPGVYLILCLVNNKRYYGESRNVSARLSQHKSRLRRNCHEVSELQHDFNLYAEENFEFFAIFLCKNSTLDERVALETKMISSFHEICYNKLSKTSHKRENNPFWGRQHTPQSIQRISESIAENRKNSIQEGFAIVLRGVIYPSISQASRETNHSRDTLRKWLNDPNNTNCVPMNPDFNPQKKGSTAELSPKQNILVSNTGFPKPVSLYGFVYSSITEAGKHKNCSRANIQRLLRNDPTNCFIVE
jgi:hypothetical protein